MQGVGTDRRKRIVVEIVSLVVISILIAFDQIAKLHFSRTLAFGEKLNVIDGFFYFTYTLNTGAAWSFLADVSWGQLFFKILTVVALIAFSLFYVIVARKGYKLLRIALILVISGTIGNFIDRLAIDAVIDFIGFTFGTYNFPIFNLADSFLVVGVIMIIIQYLFIDENAVFKKKNGNKEN